MPTGYTDAISKGITFQEYAISCARAFGACVTMRDDPIGTPIPDEFKPSDWNKRELKKAKIKLANLESMTMEDAEVFAKSEYIKESKRINQAIKKDRELMAKYRNMLAKVRLWIPPTPDHIEFKKFMESQIVQSIDFDGMEEYYQNHPATKLTGEEWLTKEKAETLRDIEYHTKEHHAEIERTNSRNAWIKALRESL